MPADAALAAPTAVEPNGLPGELKALRDKAERIATELAGLYRRVDELQEQIRQHHER